MRHGIEVFGLTYGLGSVNLCKCVDMESRFLGLYDPMQLVIFIDVAVVLANSRELTKRRRRRQLRRYKTIGFSEQKQWLCTCVLHFGTFLCRHLLNDDVK